MKILKYLFLIFGTTILTSCLGNDDDDTFNQWREKNDRWFAEQAEMKDQNGQRVYEQIRAVWDPQACVLMRWHNDRTLTQNNLSPLSNSTVDVKYHLRTIEGIAVDSSYMRTQPADSIYRAKLNSVIPGWMIAMTKMHIGDSCTVIIPYGQAYGSIQNSSIKPYSNLIFEVKLVDIPGYQKPVIE